MKVGDLVLEKQLPAWTEFNPWMETGNIGIVTRIIEYDVSKEAVCVLWSTGELNTMLPENLKVIVADNAGGKE